MCSKEGKGEGGAAEKKKKGTAASVLVAVPHALRSHSFWGRPPALQSPRQVGPEVFRHHPGRNGLSTTATWVCRLPSTSSRHRQLLRWLLLRPTTWIGYRERTWARTSEWSPSQIPDPQKPCTTTKVCFKWQRFLVICYTVIDN